MQAAAASSPKDVEGDESLRSFVDDLDHVLGAQWPSASPAARAEDWLPTLTRAVSVNRTVRSLKEEKEAVVPPVPPVVLFSARQPLGYHGVCSLCSTRAGLPISTRSSRRLQAWSRAAAQREQWTRGTSCNRP